MPAESSSRPPNGIPQEGTIGTDGDASQTIEAHENGEVHHENSINASASDSNVGKSGGSSKEKFQMSAAQRKREKRKQKRREGSVVSDVSDTESVHIYVDGKLICSRSIRSFQSI